MNWLLEIKKPFVWMLRFRHRCGYGVHSPFAFSLITDVMYEKELTMRMLAWNRSRKGRDWQEWSGQGSCKMNRFLFRLVNRIQPSVTVEVGRPSLASHYMQAAKPSASYLFASDLSELFLETGVPVDLLYLNDWKRPEVMEQAFEVCVQRVASSGVFVVHGIGYSKEMKALWKRLQDDERVGITFDWYDVGLSLF